MSKVASLENLEVRLAAFLIGRLAAEGLCTETHRELIFDAALDAADEFFGEVGVDVEMAEGFALIAERTLNDVRRDIKASVNNDEAKAVLVERPASAQVVSLALALARRRAAQLA